LGVFFNGGQVCSSTSRLLVQQSIAPRFIEQVVANAKRVKMGDPNKAEHANSPGMIGPLVCAG